MCLAVPGRIESITGEGPLDRTGKLNFGGIIKEVNLSCVPEADIGDYVLVHVGFAISKIDESEAEQLLDLLSQLQEGSTP